MAAAVAMPARQARVHAEPAGGLLWVVIGAAGFARAGAGAGIARLGLDRVHWISLDALAAGILLVGMDGSTPTRTLAGSALFGAAYIMLTGVYLVWGISALPERPATGLTIGFLTIAIGQAAGAPVFGILAGRLSMEHTVIAFALLALAAGLSRAGRLEPRPA